MNISKVIWLCVFVSITQAARKEAIVSLSSPRVNKATHLYTVVPRVALFPTSITPIQRGYATWLSNEVQLCAWKEQDGSILAKTYKTGTSHDCVEAHRVYAALENTYALEQQAKRAQLKRDKEGRCCYGACHR